MNMNKQYEVIVTKKNGVFIKDLKSEQFNRVDLSSLFFDGEPPKPSFNSHWFVIEKVPEKVERIKHQPNINHRYELIDKSMASEKVPIVMKREEVAIYEDCDWHFKPEYAHLRSLYKLVFDTQPDIMEELDFEIVAQINIDEVEEYKGFEYPVYKSRWKHEGDTTVTEKDAKTQLLDRLVFPSILLPSRPCKLTSKQTFDIIRKHVLENIDGKWAKVTSDYHFCFTVKKVIPLHETIEHMVDENLGTRRKPKFKKRYQDTRDVEIFEMTHATERYKGYTVIEPFIGDNQEDLAKNIDAYLKNLMRYINKPLKECPNCQGKGVIINKQKGEK